MAVRPPGLCVQIRKIRLPAIFKIRGSTVCLSWKMAEERSRTTFLQQCCVLSARPESASFTWRILLCISIHALFFNNAGWDELAFNANAGAIFVKIFLKIISGGESAPYGEPIVKDCGKPFAKVPRRSSWTFHHGVGRRWVFHQLKITIKLTFQVIPTGSQTEAMSLQCSDWP